uniref:Uncharacterized protein n=1 Tax=Rousettus aegyptiacus TaxID=9407 RepID=A0A7J8BDZ7_ROUAE|nr:hypothetical protein HJG63_009764 [Rousettus aegyptiacus]
MGKSQGGVGGSALGSSRGRGRPSQGGVTRDGVRAAGLSRAGSCVFRTIVECFFINSALPSPQRLSGHPETSTPRDLHAQGPPPRDLHAQGPPRPGTSTQGPPRQGPPPRDLHARLQRPTLGADPAAIGA